MVGPLIKLSFLQIVTGTDRARPRQPLKNCIAFLPHIGRFIRLLELLPGTPIHIYQCMVAEVHRIHILI